jgi:hypothetical protein
MLYAEDMPPYNRPALTKRFLSANVAVERLAT